MGDSALQEPPSRHVAESAPFNLYPELQVKETVLPTAYRPVANPSGFILPFAEVGFSQVTSKNILHHKIVGSKTFDFFSKFVEILFTMCVNFL